MFLIAILVATLQLSSIFTNPAFYSGVKNDLIMRENQFDKKNHEMVLILASLFQEFEFSRTFLKNFQFQFFRLFFEKKISILIPRTFLQINLNFTALLWKNQFRFSRTFPKIFLFSCTFWKIFQFEFYRTFFK